MKPHYDAILFAYGASRDQKLGIPGEDLKGIYSAREFVAWYNGLPGFSDLNPILDLTSTAVIIGQGNVALDVARALLTHVHKFRKTDMPEYAIDTLSKSRIKNVHVIGRRGPMQVKVSPPHFIPSTNVHRRPHSPSKKSAKSSNCPASISTPFPKPSSLQTSNLCPVPAGVSQNSSSRPARRTPLP
jgi:hypothetical protein